MRKASKRLDYLYPLLGAGAAALLLMGMAQAQTGSFTTGEKAKLDEIDKANQVQLNRILDDQLDGSLKKPEVRQLTHQLNTLVNSAYETAKDSDFSDMQAQQTLTGIRQVGQSISQREAANLAYCRRINACPDKGSKIDPAESPSF